jgi:aspartate/methionine/tyrosine aminotransferase
MTAFPWLDSGEDCRAFCTEAAQQGVLLAPGDCFSMPNHFRLGFAASAQFPRALERLSDIICRLARLAQPAFQSAKSNAGVGSSASS